MKATNEENVFTDICPECEDKHEIEYFAVDDKYSDYFVCLACGEIFENDTLAEKIRLGL